MARIYWLVLTLLPLIYGPSSVAKALDCATVISQGYFIDNQDWELSEISKKSFVPLFGSDTWNLGKKTIWFRLELGVSQCPESSNYYFLLPSLEIENIVFWQVKDGAIDQQDFYVANRNTNQYYPFRHLPTFQLNFKTQGSTTLYFKINSSRRFSFHYQLINTSERIENEISTQSLFLLFLGIALGLTIYNFYLYLVTKDIAYFYYVGYALAVVLATLINEGNADWLWPMEFSWIRFINQAACLAAILKLFYVREMLPLKVQAPALDRFIKYYLFTPVIFGAIDLIPFFHQYTTNFMTLYLSIGTGLCMAAAILSYIRNYRPAAILIVAWSITFLLVGFRFLANLGQVETNIITDHAYKLSLTFELFLLAVVLANKINLLQKELTRLNESLEVKINNRTKQLKQANKRYKENQAYVIEQEKFAALGRIADALAHEVNTPLMIIRTGASIIHHHAHELQPKAIKRRTDQIERAVDKIEKIIKALTITYLNPNSNRAGKMLDIREYLQSIIDLHSGACLQHEIDLKVTLPDELFIPGNPLHLADIISELFTGAINAVSKLEEKWIDVTVTRAKNDIVIILKDSATIGMQDPRQAMFDEIESSYTDAPIQIIESVGIGVANQIIRSYGGSLKFIQNHFYTQATIKFPIDLNAKKPF